MSQSCAVESCESTLGISCHCCDKMFCPDHLDEHYESINNQLNPLVNEINTLYDQIMKKTKEKLIGDCLEKLDTWRDECYQMINHLYEKKRQELEQQYIKKTDKQQKKINEIQLKINKLIHDHDTTQQDIEYFKSTIQIIKHEIKQIHQIYFNINIRPLELYENFISIEQIKQDEIDFTMLLSPYKTIDCPDEYNIICTTNKNFLLIHQNSELQLFNKELIMIKNISWKNHRVYDMCWLSTLNKFILLDFNKQVYLINENLTSIEQIQINPEQTWRCCTCSHTSLYLISSHHLTDIFQFDLQSSFQLIKRWKISYLSKEHDIIIDMIYNNETLALLIKNQKTHIELRSSITFDRIWLLQIDTKYDIIHPITYFCLLNSNDWLLLDYHNSRLIHVNNNGKIRSISMYNPSPIKAILFDSNILVIKTDKTWNFHEI
ncbi:unnamed protein product [Rotaria sordida]|uniref:Uncharacterized protein n=1 Tax=Rotaria sordida TaxID=392033 RepID=A0A819FKI2_9BILA|nr:unnamed protein product [Rotaria sordida]CAF3868101.1 unnamed protein product [Rotaria sordida]